MAEGTIVNTIHKSIANGAYVEVNVSSSSDYENAFHLLSSQTRNLLNTGEMMLIYFVIRYPVGGGTQGAPYYGFVIKPSNNIMLGTFYPSGISDKRMIKFRDSSSDSVATYNTIIFS